MMVRTVAGALLALVVAVHAAAGIKDLPPKYRQWLAEVEPLLGKPERKAFLKLEKDYQRDAFIERFWTERDRIPETRENEFKSRYYSRLDEALHLYESLTDDRARMYVLNGPPSFVDETDCGVYTWPIETWQYNYSERARQGIKAIFYQRNGGGPFKLWSIGEGHGVLLLNIDELASLRQQQVDFHTLVRQHCGDLDSDIDAMLAVFTEVERELGVSGVRAMGEPNINDPEWTSSFHAFSTDVEGDASELEAEIELSFPGRVQSRTRVAGTLAVASAAATLAGEGEAASYNFQLTGEVVRDEKLFESFRYRFDVPGQRLSGETIALSFERNLRPADYQLVLKLEDLNSNAVFRRELELTVPALAMGGATVAGQRSELAAKTPIEASISLGEQPDEVQSGATRVTASVTGDNVAKVGFQLDGKTILTKTRPPYSVEIDLGAMPRSHTVRAIAFDRQGEELATDEILLNPGGQSFVVRLVEPREGASANGSVRVRAEVAVPSGGVLERIEFFVGDDRAATLFQEPFVQTVALASSEFGYLRAVAYLEDGSETEDWVIVNAPDFAERVEVRMVELYAAVLDANGLPVADLAVDDFGVAENGVEQSVLRFEYLRDLPLFAGLMIDTSASMAEHFEAVGEIGRSFLAETIGPRDRAAVITFAEKPRLAAPFTNDLAKLSSALAGLRAERGTALWDSLVFTIEYFRGVKGQRALVLLSDGEDRRSGHSAEEVLRFAQHAGITIYAIALEDSVRRAGKAQLNKLAEQTGGRSFFLRSVDGLAEAYAQIQSDLRSRYLLAYQSSLEGDDGFRAINVEIADRELEVRTLQGYFP